MKLSVFVFIAVFISFVLPFAGAQGIAVTSGVKLDCINQGPLNPVFLQACREIDQKAGFAWNNGISKEIGGQWHITITFDGTPTWKVRVEALMILNPPDLKVSSPAKITEEFAILPDKNPAQFLISWMRLRKRLAIMQGQEIQKQTEEAAKLAKTHRS